VVLEGSGRRLPVSVGLLMEARCNSMRMGPGSRGDSAPTGVPLRMGSAEVAPASGCLDVRAVRAGDMSLGRGWSLPRAVTSLDSTLTRLRPCRAFSMVPAWPSPSQLVLM
jgi:hypothetical protein